LITESVFIGSTDFSPSGSKAFRPWLLYMLYL